MLQAIRTFEQPCSFSGDTLISTEMGFIPIRNVKPGDLVYAHNTKINQTGLYTVTASIVHTDSRILSFFLGGEVIETTPNHPFFVNGQWVSAGAIKTGDPLTSKNGQIGYLQASSVTDFPQEMYNLSVAEAHTYFVGIGQWLVHNACGKNLRNNMKAPDWATDNPEIPWQAHHVIPKEEEGHNFVVRAKSGGFEFDSAENGIGLPASEEAAIRLGLTRHQGKHSNYTSMIRSRLDELEDRAINENWSDQQSAAALREVVSKFKELLPKWSLGKRLN